MIDHIDKSGVSISWDAPRHDGGSRLQGYIVEKRTPFSPRWTRINRQPIRGTDTRVTDLYKGDEYEFRVVAVNEAGMGKPSDMTPPVAIKDPFGNTFFLAHLIWIISDVLLLSKVREIGHFQCFLGGRSVGGRILTLWLAQFGRPRWEAEVGGRIRPPKHSASHILSCDLWGRSVRPWESEVWGRSDSHIIRCAIKSLIFYNISLAEFFKGHDLNLFRNLIRSK